MLHEVSFKSFNGRDDVQGWIYVPASEHKGIIQLIHGFGEHSRRYLHMIVRFMEAGYIVAADDHVGHGKTAIVNNSWGDWGEKGPHTMMEDEHTLTGIVSAMYPNLPCFLFGHSMGSFIARDYMATYGDELAGATICGTSGVFPGLQQGMDVLQKLVDAGKGAEADPSIGGLLMGWMFERCPEGVKYGNEWICSDPHVQLDHAQDPFDAFTKPTSNRAFLYFCQMIDYITGPEWAKQVPTRLPIYNIGGSEDPVGQFGEGLKQVSQWLEDSGHSVTTKLYDGYRHEIHNYSDIKNAVSDGIIDFFDAVIRA